MKWSTAVGWLLSLAVYGLVMQAGYNLSRLDVPDTVAGPAQYLAWVGGFLGLALLTAALRSAFLFFADPVAVSAVKTAIPPGLPSLGKLARDAIAAGDLNQAQIYLDAAMSIYPVDKGPKEGDAAIRLVTSE